MCMCRMTSVYCTSVKLLQPVVFVLVLRLIFWATVSNKKMKAEAGEGCQEVNSSPKMQPCMYGTCKYLNYIGLSIATFTETYGNFRYTSTQVHWAYSFGILPTAYKC